MEKPILLVCKKRVYLERSLNPVSITSENRKMFHLQQATQTIIHTPSVTGLVLFHDLKAGEVKTSVN